jgi:hypothetical protein
MYIPDRHKLESQSSDNWDVDHLHCNPVSSGFFAEGGIMFQALEVCLINDN